MKQKLLFFIRSCLPDILVRNCYRLIGAITLFRHRNLSDKGRFPLRFLDINLILNEGTKNTQFDSHYVLHPAWAARIISRNKPQKHVDISSSINFATMLSAFIPTDFYEYQPSDISLSSLFCQKGDLMSLPFPDQSVASLSCMHVVEHIGLGRYGDPYDPNGDVKAAKELSRILAPGGTLLFVVPVGMPRLCFNAHRIYSYEMIVDFFPDLKIESFTLIDDSGRFIENCDPSLVASQKYACGCFELKRE